MTEQALLSPQQADGVRNPVGRSFQLLRWMAEQPESQHGVREIAKALGMAPSTVSRALGVLESEGIVSQDQHTGLFGLGLELLRLGQLASAKFDLRKVARPHLQAVVAACNESVFLGVYDHNRHQMLRIDTVSSSHPLRYVVELDRWTEVYRGASGLSILAFLPADERAAVYTMAEAQHDPTRPWPGRETVEKELELIRTRGYACTHGRRIPGAVGITAPIFGGSGEVFGDFILTLPEQRFAEHGEQALAELVMGAAAAITAAIGGRKSEVVA